MTVAARVTCPGRSSRRFGGRLLVRLFRERATRRENGLSVPVTTVSGGDAVTVLAVEAGGAASGIGVAAVAVLLLVVAPGGHADAVITLEAGGALHVGDRASVAVDAAVLVVLVAASVVTDARVLAVIVAVVVAAVVSSVAVITSVLIAIPILVLAAGTGRPAIGRAVRREADLDEAIEEEAGACAGGGLDAGLQAQRPFPFGADLGHAREVNRPGEGDCEQRRPRQSELRGSMPTSTPRASLLALRVTSIVEVSAPAGTSRVTPSDGRESVPPAGPMVACVRRLVEPHPVAHPAIRPATSAMAKKMRDSVFINPPANASPHVLSEGDCPVAETSVTACLVIRADCRKRNRSGRRNDRRCWCRVRRRAPGLARRSVARPPHGSRP